MKRTWPNGNRSLVYKIALSVALVSTLIWIITLCSFVGTRSAEDVKSGGGTSLFSSGNRNTNSRPVFTPDDRNRINIDNPNPSLSNRNSGAGIIKPGAKPVVNIDRQNNGANTSSGKLRLLEKDSPRPEFYPKSSSFQQISRSIPDYSSSEVLLISNYNRTHIIPATFSDLSSASKIASLLSYSSSSSLRLFLPDFNHTNFVPSTSSSSLLSSKYAATSTPLRVVVTESDGDHYRKYNGAFVLLLAMGAGNNNQFKDYVEGKSRDMIRCLQSIQYYNSIMSVNYPVIVFYSRLPSDVISNFQKKIDQTKQAQGVSVSRLLIHWVDVESFFPPGAWPDDLEVFKNIPFSPDYPIGSTCRYTKWWIEYLHMCRFRLVFQWFHPIFLYYDYAIQMDIDASIDTIRTSITDPSIIANDLFSWFSTLDATFGYYRCETALSGCTNKLQETVDRYVKEEKGGEWNNEMGVWDGVNFWAGFYGWDVKKVQANKEMFRFIDYVDKTGNVYFERWGEQTILPFALSMGADSGQMFWWADVQVGHYGQPYHGARTCGRNYKEPVSAATVFKK